MNTNLFIVFFCYITVIYCADVQISINWNNITGECKTTPTLQVVVNPLLRRESSVHDNLFNSLSFVGAEFVRFVPWLPYPQLAVAELQPPFGNPSPATCGTVSDFGNLNIYCANNSTINNILFASYGTSTGSCGFVIFTITSHKSSFQVSSCNAKQSLQVVQKYCLGQTSCTIPATPTVFGEDPCYGIHKHLSVQATCSQAPNVTFWDFSLIDPMMEDFMAATAGHSVIINFSTSPEWLWNTDAPITYPSDPDEVFWGYEKGTQLRDWSMKDIQNYYKRLVSWYTNGGFTDEYGVFHSSGHSYDIPIWEVLNEVEAEHSMSVEYYTQIYDAIVTGIQEVQPDMQFVGMALSAPMNELDWFQYFLNSSNHLPGIPLDFISYHFYASCDNRTSLDDYLTFFDQADNFIEHVIEIEQVRKSLSPSTRTDIDELGVILPNDNVPDPVPIPNEYWNAAGAMFAYIYGTLAQLGIDILGESQLAGYPTQYPSVSEIDWNTGLPNARLFVLSLLVSNFELGDQFVSTTSSDSDVFALAFNSWKNGKQILLVNKLYNPMSVELEGVNGGYVTYTDTNVGFNGTVTETFSGSTIDIGPWAVAIVTVSE